MPLRPKRNALRARERLHSIRAAVAGFDLLCRDAQRAHDEVWQAQLPLCQRPRGAPRSCIYEWAHMRGGKPTHRYVTAQQALILRQAIANYRRVKKLLREWEDNTERLIDAEHPPQP